MHLLYLQLHWGRGESSLRNSVDKAPAHSLSLSHDMHDKDVGLAVASISLSRPKLDGRRSVSIQYVHMISESRSPAARNHPAEKPNESGRRTHV